MIVWECLNTFWAILKIFDSYRAHTSPWKMDDFGILVIFPSFLGKNCQNHRFWRSVFGVKKSLKIELYWSKNRFFGLFDNFRLFLTNPEKKIFFSIFREFSTAQIRVFEIFVKWRKKKSCFFGVILQKCEKCVFGL